MDVLVFLTSLTILLLAGIVSLSLSKKLGVPSSLVLFLVGIVLGNASIWGHPLVQLTTLSLSVFSVLVFSVILFDAVSKLRLTHIDSSFKRVSAFFVVSLILNFVVLKLALEHYFGFSWFASVLFICMASCIEFVAVFPKNHVPKNHVTQLSKDESILSCAFMLVVPFLLITFLQTVKPPVTGLISVLPFIASVFAGIGTGIVVSLVFFSLARMKKFQEYVLWLVGGSVLLAFVLAQQMQGSGIVAVATMGLIFGSVVFRQRFMIQNAMHKIESVVEIFLFLIVGVMVGVPLTGEFMRLSAGLFVLYVLLRFIASELTLRKYNFFERTEMALFVPKGLATVSLALVLLNYQFDGDIKIVQLLLAFFVCSLLFDTILEKIGFYKHR